MPNFEATWKMVDAADSEVTITMRGENVTDGVNTLAARKEFIEKALERGWTLVTGKSQESNTNGKADGPRCPHGARIWKSGTSRSTGKPYKGWFCPQRGSDCEPLFVRDKKPKAQYEEPPEYGEYR